MPSGAAQRALMREAAGIPDEAKRDEIYRRSRGGKGSRLINVLWMNIGEQKAVPERILKKHRSPKQ